MFDSLSDRLGGVFDKLKGHEAFPAEVGTTSALRKRDRKESAPVMTGGLRHV